LFEFVGLKIVGVKLMGVVVGKGTNMEQRFIEFDNTGWLCHSCHAIYKSTLFESDPNFQ